MLSTAALKYHEYTIFEWKNQAVFVIFGCVTIFVCQRILIHVYSVQKSIAVFVEFDKNLPCGFRGRKFCLRTKKHGKGSDIWL